jgi:5'-phosphate synthase pdxT subunit
LVKTTSTIGVLALQGDFAAHVAVLRRLGLEPVEVRDPERLRDLDGLVMPGGESTTLLNLMQDGPWFDELRRLAREGAAIFATCAGAILLAREVRDPAQPSLGLLDVVVQRNGYGRQVDSFEVDLDVAGLEGPVRGVFIRAPRFLEVGQGVEVLARRGAEPVLVRQGRIVAAAFHPELSDDSRLHRLFADLAAARATAAVQGGYPC